MSGPFWEWNGGHYMPCFVGDKKVRPCFRHDLTSFSSYRKPASLDYSSSIRILRNAPLRAQPWMGLPGIGQGNSGMLLLEKP